MPKKLAVNTYYDKNGTTLLINKKNRLKFEDLEIELVEMAPTLKRALKSKK